MTAQSPQHSSTLLSRRSARRPKKRIGEILVEQGAATRSQIARVLAEQHELPFLELTALMVEPEAATLLPEQLAKRYSAIPVNIQGDAVVVAVADPTNIMHSDDLRLAIGMSVKVVVAPSDAIDFAIQKTYDGADVQLVAVEEEVPEEEDDATKIDLNHESPAVVFVNRSIAKALDIGASDIHFTPQAKRLHVRARVDGVMREIASVSNAQGTAVTSRLKIMGGLDIAERRAPQDGRVSIRRGEETIDVRVAVLPTAHGEKTRCESSRRATHPSRLQSSRCGRGAKQRCDGRSSSRSARSSSSGRRDRERRQPSTPVSRSSTLRSSRWSRSRIRSSIAPPASIRSRSTRGRG